MSADTAFDLIPILLLAGVLLFAVSRPKGLSEVVVAAPAGLLVVLLGFETFHEAFDQMHRLLSVVIFLGAILVLSEACARDGLFDATGAYVARLSRGRPKQLLGFVFVVSALTTAVLSLDATVVLLTPVVIKAAQRVKVDARPSALACGHLSNSASLLFPVSNLTNLLVFSATGLTFVSFAGRMLVPTVLTVVAEYLAFRLWFRKSLRQAPVEVAEAPIHPPVFAVVVVALVLIGFGLSSLVNLEPVWVACIGALVMSAKALMQRQAGPVAIAKSINVGFCLFVLALAVLVQAVASDGVGQVVRNIVPAGDSFLVLLAVAAIAGVLSNVLNNIPATLLLAAVLGTSSSTRLLAILIGVNIGPNLTYVGSLATLLWRKAIRKEDVQVSFASFTGLGALSVVICLLAATFGLWITS